MADANYSGHAELKEEFNNAELNDIRGRLAEMMGNGDEKTKRLIFNQVICGMTVLLPEPELSSVVPLKQAPSTVTLNWSDWSDADTKLSEASYLAEFIQSISLNVRAGECVTLQPGQLTGFYFAMQSAMDRIAEARALLDKRLDKASTPPREKAAA